MHPRPDSPPPRSDAHPFPPITSPPISPLSPSRSSLYSDTEPTLLNSPSSTSVRSDVYESDIDADVDVDAYGDGDGDRDGDGDARSDTNSVETLHTHLRPMHMRSAGLAPHPRVEVADADIVTSAEVVTPPRRPTSAPLPPHRAIGFGFAGLDASADSSVGVDGASDVRRRGEEGDTVYEHGETGRAQQQHDRVRSDTTTTTASPQLTPTGLYSSTSTHLPPRTSTPYTQSQQQQQPHPRRSASWHTFKPVSSFTPQAPARPLSPPYARPRSPPTSTTATKPATNPPPPRPLLDALFLLLSLPLTAILLALLTVLSYFLSALDTLGKSSGVVVRWARPAVRAGRVVWRIGRGVVKGAGAAAAGGKPGRVGGAKGGAAAGAGAGGTANGYAHANGVGKGGIGGAGNGTGMGQGKHARPAGGAGLL